MTKRWKSDLILLFVAAVWGSGFVAQRLAAAQMSSFYFNGARFIIAAGLLFLLARLQRPEPDDPGSGFDRKQLPMMILVGVLLFAGAALQQMGLETTSIGNASFITGLYLVLIPVILFVFWRQHIAWISWAAVFIATIGTLLLSMQGEMRLARGDAFVLVGAVMWALQIIMVGRLSAKKVNVLWFAVVQFTTSGLLNLLVAFSLDPQGVLAFATAWPPVLYSALVPIGLGFTLQIAGQRDAPTVDAALIMSMEAVFGTFFGYLILHEMLTLRQVAGCGLILAAMILAQLRPADVTAGVIENAASTTEEMDGVSTL